VSFKNSPKNSSKSPKVGGFSGCVLNFLRVLGFLFLILLSLVVGESRPGLGLALAFLTFCWLVSRWVMGFPLRSWYGWAIVGVLCAFFLQFNDKSHQGNKSKDDDNTSVKDEESKEVGEASEGGGGSDFIIQSLIGLPFAFTQLFVKGPRFFKASLFSIFS